MTFRVACCPRTIVISHQGKAGSTSNGLIKRDDRLNDPEVCLFRITRCLVAVELVPVSDIALDANSLARLLDGRRLLS